MLPEPLTRGLPPPDPHPLCPLSSTEFVEPPPTEKKSWLRHCLEVFAQIRVQQYKAFEASHTHTHAHALSLSHIHTHTHARARARAFESSQQQRIIRMPNNVELFVRKILISPSIWSHLHFNSVKIPSRRITTCYLWNKIARLQKAYSVTWYVNFTKALFFFKMSYGFTVHV